MCREVRYKLIALNIKKKRKKKKSRMREREMKSASSLEFWQVLERANMFQSLTSCAYLQEKNICSSVK